MLKKTCLALGAAVVLLLVGALLFLQHGLTDSMRKYVLPAVKEKLQADVAVEKFGVNLLGGSLSLSGVRVANPPGFEEPEMASFRRLRIKVGMLKLLKGGIADIRKVAVRDGVLTVARGRDGALNIAPLVGLKEDIRAAVAAPAGPGAPPADGKPVHFGIKLLEVSTLVHYIDHRMDPDPFRLTLDLRARLQNVANYGDEDVLSGSLALQGRLLLAGGESCAFDLNGRMAPFVDPNRLSFEVSGSMQELEISAFKQLARRRGIESGRISGAATLLCKRGVLDPEKSILRLTLKDIKLTPDNRAFLPSGRLVEQVTVEVPVQGTLDRPQVDFSGVLEKILTNPDNLRAVLKSLQEEPGQGGSRTDQVSGADSGGASAALPASDSGSAAQEQSEP